MIHPGMRFSVAGLLLCLSAAAWSATYDITTTADHPQGEGTEGECSLRDAMEAINTETDVNDCGAGTGNERIRLQPGELYELEHGPLIIGGEGEGEDGEDVTPSVRFQLGSGSENAVLVAPEGERAFEVIEGAGLVLESLTVKAYGYEVTDDTGTGVNGTACAAQQVTGDGGLIRSLGELELRSKTRVLGGHADGHGGGIFLGMENTLVLQDAMVADNCAGVDGGGIYLEEFSRNLQASRFYIGNNDAGGSGGGLYGDGAEGAVVILENGTIARNFADTGGSGLHLGVEHELVMNNVTLAGNQGGTAGLHYSGQDDLVHVVANTALVGNEEQDCEASPAGSADIEGANVVSDAGCPFGDTAGGIEVLRGQDTDGEHKSIQCDDESCYPLAADTLDSDFPGFLPEFPPAGEEPGVGNDALLFNGGAVSGQFSCPSQDQRGKSRTEAEGCDIGAIEFQVATGSASFFDHLSSGESGKLDVVENDLGDTTVDCRGIGAVDEEPGEDGVEFPLPSPGDDDWTQPGHADWDSSGTCLYLSQNTSRNVDLSVHVDEDGYPTVLYEPRSSFDGFDFFSYRVDREAFDGATFADRDVSARASVQARPSSGFEESEDIDDFISSTPLAGLVLIFLVGLLRREGSRRLRVPAAMLVFALPGMALGADIVVNSLNDNDPIQPEPGVCTLRGAIDSAMDEWQSASYCDSGRKGTNHILIDREGTIKLDHTVVVDRENPVVIEGQGVDKTTVKGVCNGNGFRLFETNSNVSFRNLTLECGNAEEGNGGAVQAGRDLVLENVRVKNNDAAGAGGAIYMGPGATEDSLLTIRRTHFLGNSATSGGAIATSENRTHHIQIEASTFEGNSATGGGVFHLLSDGDMDVSNSTFYGNSATDASVLHAEDLPDGATVRLMNSTLLRNQNSNAFLLPDNSDDAGSVLMANSFYLAQENDGCAGGGFSRLEYNLFSAAENECTAYDNNSDADDTNQWADDWDENDLADVMAAELDDAVEESDEFIPPVVGVTSAMDAERLILEAGSESDVQQGFGSPFACRNQDKRGERRPTGDRCDRGAYEFQSPTAGEVAADNRGRSDRVIILKDVLEDAVSGDGFVFDPSSLKVRDQDPVEDEDGNFDGLGDACVLPREAKETACEDKDGVEDDEVEEWVIRYEAPGFPDYDDGFECSDLPADLKLHYSFEVYECDEENEEDCDPQNAPSVQEVEGIADLRLFNVPPSTHSGRRAFEMRPGNSLEISLAHIEDPDGDNRLMRLRMPDGDATNFARSRKKDPDCDEQEEICEYERLGKGLELPVACSLDYPEREDKVVVFDEDGGFSCKMEEDLEDPDDKDVKPFYEEGEGFLIHPENRALKYHHGSTFQNFRDRFSVDVTDECGASSSARYEITFPENSSTSDDVISSVSWSYLVLLVIGGYWRRRYS